MDYSNLPGQNLHRVHLSVHIPVCQVPDSLPDAVPARSIGRPNTVDHFIIVGQMKVNQLKYDGSTVRRRDRKMHKVLKVNILWSIALS